jgi:predicted short-subunit dehydrogenase-like oxidoreductase (DUF2520 family)
MSLKFCFIGAGNLATHLALELHCKVGAVIQVYSRTNESATLLANKLGCSFTTSISEITTEADVYFVALKDAVVTEVLSAVDFQNKLIVHTSGSLPMSVLTDFSENTGVFYPLQTFSKSRAVDFSNIPVFIEANSNENKNKLAQIAEQITDSVLFLDSEKRKSLHIAAVFACNFTNHFYALAASFLESKDISFDVLKPLIKETAEKVQEMHPAKAQTGPAIRYDENIISKHLADLEAYPELKELYKTISKSIFAHHQKNQ